MPKGTGKFWICKTVFKRFSLIDLYPLWTIQIEFIGWQMLYYNPFLIDYDRLFSFLEPIESNRINEYSPNSSAGINLDRLRETLCHFMQPFLFNFL